MVKQIQERLNRAVDNLPHPDAKKLWDTPVHKMEEHDYITRQETGAAARRRPRARGWAISFACAVMLCAAGLGWYTQNVMVAAIVDLDVNPSFEISLNRRQRVLEVQGINQEALEILEGRDYKGWAVEDAVETLMLSVDDRQYLVYGQENAVLLSVRDNERQRADELSRRLSHRVQQTVDREGTPTTVLRQSYDRVETAAAVAGVSDGKLRLARQLAASLPGTTAEDLARLPLEELEALLSGTEMEVESVSVDRSAWIGRAGASAAISDQWSDPPSETGTPPEESSDQIWDDEWEEPWDNEDDDDNDAEADDGEDADDEDESDDLMDDPSDASGDDPDENDGDDSDDGDSETDPDEDGDKDDEDDSDDGDSGDADEPVEDSEAGEEDDDNESDTAGSDSAADGDDASGDAEEDGGDESEDSSDED